MNKSSSGPDLLNELAHEFAERFRGGERPSVTEYTARYPELEAEIRDLFPAMAMIEEFGSVVGPPIGPSAQTATSDGQAPRQLGEYRIVREVARGGMGIVYEAVQESLGRHVALKVLPFQSLAGANHRERFRREAQAAAKLHHTNIVPVFGVGEHEGVHYFAMQFIQGQSLDSVLHELKRRRRTAESHPGEAADDSSPVPEKRRSLALTVTVAEGLITGRFRCKNEAGCDLAVDGPPPCVEPARVTSSAPDAAHAVVAGDRSELGVQSDVQYFRSVARVGVQVAEALAYAHQQGIVHRDIKPSNLLLDTQGTVWITDFGLAKAEGTDELTSPGDLVGTLRYMAPERFRGQSDPRSDIFSLGLTLYEMVALRPAFAASERAQLIERMLRAEPPRPRQLDGRIPRDLETLILKAIAREPAERYSSADALAEDLRRFLSDRTILARRSTPQERTWRWCRRNPALSGSLAAVGLLMLVLTIGSIAAAMSQRRAASRLRAQRNLALGNAARAGRAERDATEKLWNAYLAEARAGRFSGRVSRRFEGLDALRKAATLDTFPDRRRELRDEAIACMALIDLRAARHWETGEFASLTRGMPAFDPAHHRYVRLEPGKTLRIARAADDVEICRLLADPANEYWPVFSPDGRFLVVGYGFASRPSNYQVWDLERGKRAEGLPSVAIACEFRPDGRQLAIAQPDGAVGIFDLPSWKQVGRWNAGGLVYSLAFHPDGTKLAAVVDQRPEIRICDRETGRALRTLSTLNPVASLAWRGDGRILAASCGTRIEVLDVISGQLISVLDGHQNAGIVMGFNHSGDLLASQSWDGTTRLWDPVVGRQHVSLPGTFLGWGPDDRSVLVFEGSRVTSYELARAEECLTLAHGMAGNRMPDRMGDPWGLGFSPDNRLLASAGVDGVRIFRVHDGKELRHLAIGSSESALFHPSGDLLTYGEAGLARWPARRESGDATRFGPPEFLKLPANPIGTWRYLEQDRHGRKLIIVDRGNHQAVVVDLDAPRNQPLLLPHRNIGHAALSPDGRWAATATWKGNQVKFWDASTGAVVNGWRSGDARVGFSPDSRWFVTCHGDTYRFHEVGSWQPGPVVRHGHPNAPTPMAFRADGQVLAIVTMVQQQAMVTLVDPATGREITSLQAPETFGINALRFSPDGSKLAVATVGHRIQLWDLRMVRQRLASLGLEQCFPTDQPTGAPVAPASTEGPVRILTDLGDHDFPAYDEPTPQNLASLTAELQADPGRAETYVRRGRVLAKMGKFDEAIGDFTRALEIRPKRARVLAARAEARLSRKQFMPAVADFEAALAIDPDQTWSRNYLAWLLATCPDDTIRDPGRAVELARKAIELEPKDGNLWNTLGVAHYRAGDGNAAIEALTRSIELSNGGDGNDWFFLAMAHWKRGDKPQALAWFGKAARWMQTNQPADEELRRFSAEAADLLDVKEKKD